MTGLSPTKLFHELRRREVFKTAALYIVGAWVVLQVAELALPALEIPEVAIRYVWIGAILLFPLVLVFGWRYDLSTSGIRRTLPAEAVEEDRALQSGDYWFIGSLSSVALAVIAVMGLQVSRVEPERAMAAAENSIAVLPFQACADQPSNLLLARSLTSEVINRLAERKRLKVTGRTSSFAVAGFGLSLAEMAEPLRVEYLLTGILCDEADLPTLEVELSDAGGYIVWRGRFQQKVTESDQIIERLATLAGNAVAAQLGDVLAGQRTETPVDRRAYQQLLIGREQWREGNREEAEAALEKALEYEPEYVDALLTLAAFKARAWRMGEDLRNSIRSAQPEADRALELAEAEVERNPESYEAHAVAARIKHIISHWEEELLWREDAGDLTPDEIETRKAAILEDLSEQERHLRKAIALNPSEADYYRRLIDILEHQGPARRNEALEIAEGLLERDPFNTWLTGYVAKRWVQRGRYRRAMELMESFEQLPEIPPSIWYHQLEFAQIEFHWDDKCEILIDMLLNDPEAFEVGGNRFQVIWFLMDLGFLGLTEQAEAWYERIVDMPSPFRDLFMNGFHVAMGRGEEVHARELSKIDPKTDEEILDDYQEDVARAAATLWDDGQRERAVALMESAQHAHAQEHLQERQMWGSLQLAAYYIDLGREKEAMPILERIVEYHELEYETGIREPMMLSTLAMAYAGLRRDDEGLAMLRKAVDYNYRNDAYGDSTDPRYPSLYRWERFQDDPRYIAQIERQKADWKRQAERVRSMLAEHDIDELLAPLVAIAEREKSAAEEANP